MPSTTIPNWGNENEYNCEKAEKEKLFLIEWWRKSNDWTQTKFNSYAIDAKKSAKHDVLLAVAFFIVGKNHHRHHPCKQHKHVWKWNLNGRKKEKEYVYAVKFPIKCDAVCMYVMVVKWTNERKIKYCRENAFINIVRRLLFNSRVKRKGLGEWKSRIQVL